MWIYLSALILALGAIAGVWLYRRHQRDAYFDAKQEQLLASFAPDKRPARYSTASESPPTSKADQSGAITEARPDERDASSLYLPESSSRERRCPRCHRTFPSSIVVCPVDSVPLEDASSHRGEESLSSPERLDRMSCTGCERRYAVDAEYCYHDGIPLTRDTRDAAADAPVYRACESCGWEGHTDEMTCPNDGDELIAIDPSDSSSVSPTIPMLVCPECREFAPPGHAHCPDDGTLLTPITNMRVTEFPEGGFGPRRKICKKCGTQFSSAALYCSHDGAKLMPLN